MPNPPTTKRRVADLPDDLIVSKGTARTAPPAPPADVRQRGAEETDYVHLTFVIPRWLRKQLKRDAIDQGTTVRGVVLTALRNAGYQITEDELTDRRFSKDRD